MCLGRSEEFPGRKGFGAGTLTHREDGAEVDYKTSRTLPEGPNEESQRFLHTPRESSWGSTGDPEEGEDTRTTTTTRTPTLEDRSSPTTGLR